MQRNEIEFNINFINKISIKFIKTMLTVHFINFQSIGEIVRPEIKLFSNSKSIKPTMTHLYLTQHNKLFVT